MEKISQKEIKEKLKDGIKIFENLKCKGVDFQGMIFENVNFLNCDLSFASFENCTLKKCKIEDTILFWSSFAKAKIYNTTFNGVKIAWSKLNDAYFENCELIRTDLQYSIALDSNIKEGCEIKDANLSYFTTKLSELTGEGMQMTFQKLEKIKDTMPSDLFRILKRSVKNTKTQMEITDSVQNAVNSYTTQNNINAPLTTESQNKKTGQYKDTTQGQYKKSADISQYSDSSNDRDKEKRKKEMEEFLRRTGRM
mgnify:CR=1 FL=1